MNESQIRLWRQIGPNPAVVGFTKPESESMSSLRGMPGSPVAVRTGISLLGRRLLPRVWQHCGQLTFQLVWCHEHSAVTATKLLQPQDLACGTLFRSICATQTSPTDCSDDSWRDTFFGNHEHGALWLLICWHHRKKHLLTALVKLHRCCVFQDDLSRLLAVVSSQTSKLPLISMNNGQTLVSWCMYIYLCPEHCRLTDVTDTFSLSVHLHDTHEGGRS